MKRTLLFLLLALTALAVTPATVTLYGTAGNTCAFANSISDRAGNVTFYCSGVAVVTPLPQPPPPPPPATPPPPPAGSVELQTLANTNASATHTGSAGVTYTFALPRCELSQCQFEFGSDPASPTELDVEVGFSPSPGDLAYWRNAPVMSGRGAQSFPCGIVAGGSQGFSRRWGPIGTFDVCPVDARQWYVSIRYGPSCGGSCKFAYKVNFK